MDGIESNDPIRWPVTDSNDLNKMTSQLCFGLQLVKFNVQAIHKRVLGDRDRVEWATRAESG